VLDVASIEATRRLVARGAGQIEAEAGARLADLDAVARELSGRAPPAIRLSLTEQRLLHVVPTLAGGPAEFLSGRGRVAGESNLHNLMAFEVANAVDGRRSGLDIYRLVAAEAQAAGSYYYGTVSPEAVERHLAALAAAGLVRLGP
jgi:hypothetical protein